MTYSTDDLADQLQAAFGFTDEDLKANRSGKLSARQQQQLENDRMGYWQQAGLTVVVVAIATVLGSVQVSLSGSLWTDRVFWPGVFGLVIAGTVAFLVWLYRHRRSTRTDFSDVKAVALQGRVQIVEPISGTVGSLRLGKRSFWQLSQVQFDVMRQLSDAALPVTIYCPGHHNHILSVELHKMVNQEGDFREQLRRTPDGG